MNLFFKITQYLNIKFNLNKEKNENVADLNIKEDLMDLKNSNQRSLNIFYVGYKGQKYQKEKEKHSNNEKIEEN